MLLFQWKNRGVYKIGEIKVGSNCKAQIERNYGDIGERVFVFLRMGKEQILLDLTIKKAVENIAALREN